MGQAALQLPMTSDAFLEWDASQRIKHEFVRGEVFAMAGAGEAHVTVTGNLFVKIRQHVAGSPCRAFFTDMKLRVEAADAFYYPDVMVTCSALDAQDRMVKREPSLIIEVLSPSTAGYDRGEKFAAYRLLPSLQEFGVVDTDSRRCDVHRKNADGLWVLHSFGPDEGLRLASVDLDISPADLWADVPQD